MGEAAMSTHTAASSPSAAHPGAAHTRADDQADIAEINALIDGWHDAAARGDFERYVAAMTDDAVFLGTDASERWAGEEFRRFARPYFKGPTEYGKGAWTYRPATRFVTLAAAAGAGAAGPTADPAGPADGAHKAGVAWFDELLTHDTYGRCRGTGVVVRVPRSGAGPDPDDAHNPPAHQWRIAHYSLTFLVPNDVAREVTGRIREFEAGAPTQPPPRK